MISRNSKSWPMTIFYGLLNMAAINANIIFQENANKRNKRTELLRNLGLSLGYTHLQLQWDQNNIPVYIHQKISSQTRVPLRPVAQNEHGRYAWCVDCPRKQDRKTKCACTVCGKAICLHHAIFSCKKCTDFEWKY